MVSFLPSNVSWDSRYEAVETVQQSTVKYMEELEAELSSMPGYKESENVKREMTCYNKVVTGVANKIYLNP